jgi:hypothetical protein
MDQKFSLFLFLLFIAIFTSPAMTQDFRQPVPPDYKQIRETTLDKGSPLSYQNLMDRYRANDTTLTESDFRLLYYGFLYQPGFSPYGISTYSDSVRALMGQDSLRMMDFPKMIRFETMILNEYPFNLRDLNAIGYAYERMGDTANAIFAGYKLNMIVNTILSTGDGIADSTAWHIISVGHEYDIMNLLGFQFGGEQSLTITNCDFLTVEENKYGIEGLYFDVKELMKAESRELDKHSRKKKGKKDGHDDDPENK